MPALPDPPRCRSAATTGFRHTKPETPIRNPIPNENAAGGPVSARTRRKAAPIAHIVFPAPPPARRATSSPPRISRRASTWMPRRVRPRAPQRECTSCSGCRTARGNRCSSCPLSAGSLLLLLPPAPASTSVGTGADAGAGNKATSRHGNRASLQNPGPAAPRPAGPLHLSRIPLRQPGQGCPGWGRSFGRFGRFVFFEDFDLLNMIQRRQGTDADGRRRGGEAAKE